MIKEIRDKFSEYPGWVLWGIVGAIVIFLSGPIIGISISIYKSITLRNPEYFLDAILLIVVSVIGGWTSGIVCYFTRLLWLKGRLGKYFYSIIMMECYLWPLTIFMVILSLLNPTQLPDLDVPVHVFCTWLHVYGIGLATVVWLLLTFSGLHKKTHNKSLNRTGDNSWSG